MQIQKRVFFFTFMLLEIKWFFLKRSVNLLLLFCTLFTDFLELKKMFALLPSHKKWMTSQCFFYAHPPLHVCSELRECIWVTILLQPSPGPRGKKLNTHFCSGCPLGTHFTSSHAVLFKRCLLTSTHVSFSWKNMPFWICQASPELRFTSLTTLCLMSSWIELAPKVTNIWLLCAGLIAFLHHPLKIFR